MESIKELRRICQHPDPTDCDAADNFLYTKMWRTISIYITRLLLYTSIKPNHVTMFMVFWGIIVGFLFSIGTYWYMLVGSLALEFLWVLDTIDGEIARYKKIFSLNGPFLDLTAHLTNTSLPLAGITIGLYKFRPDFYIILAGFSAVVFSLLFLTLQAIKHQIFFRELVKVANRIKQIKPERMHKKIIAKSKPKNTFKSIAKMINILFDHILIIQTIFLGAVFNKLHWVLVFYGLTFPLMWVSKLIYEYRTGYKSYEHLLKPYKK